MNARIALLSASLFALVACGEGLPGSEEDGGTGSQSHGLSSGTYVVSNAVLASQADQCGLLGAYTDPEKRIGITVDDQSGVTFNLSNSATAPPESLDRGVLSGNAIDQYMATRYTVAFDDTCVVRIHRTVSGTVVNADTAELTLDFSVSTEAGTCDGNNTAFNAVPCSSTYQFTATRE